MAALCECAAPTGAAFRRSHQKRQQLPHQVQVASFQSSFNQNLSQFSHPLRNPPISLPIIHFTNTSLVSLHVTPFIIRL